ncbi:TPA_asm: RNA-directed RNA polymerase [ssRNA phage Esthiorhiza.4_12]|uniref:RNA-directed RNA polymerase n=2 Tax=Leviviricetes TaxID=2842243 RepID=A0A8S5KYX1_9VIRU|nr:RNA-directed RNA polymerase [ssRNA phage Esthiorhiza.4_12]QDH91493.1 MAG: RNA-dependent RNA polymerase [Leviviridae sp.]DAD50387.1 TPA_asm: RNA-directed RNA polymerase [ssRNA phage Esthiorhiza.4_12]
MRLDRLPPILEVPVKSNVSDYLELVSIIYRDATTRCSADVSDLRDLITIRSRTEHEGLSFLTITLPSFCKAIERCLALGYIDPSFRSTLFRGFPFNGQVPAFLQGVVGQLFSRENGRINDENVSTLDTAPYVDAIRQICLCFNKVQLPCTPEREHAAIESFIAIERSFQELSTPKEVTDEFKSVSSVLWDNIVYNLRYSELLPRHGPGATAERISGNSKYSWQSWYERLDNYFPFFDYAYLTSAVESKEFKGVSFISEDEELPVRVTPVPKTLKGPRIIAIEPVCMQYAQQAIRSVLYDVIEGSRIAGGHVNFRDQSVNQKIALTSSFDGQFATIDLSEASDRVPCDLAMEMFSAYPEFSGLVEACRSKKAVLPDGRIIGPLRKFASMGSALCFPVESMYFYTICVAALLRSQNLPCTPRNCYIVSRSVYVYGDDIIVPTNQAGIVLEYLQKYNCKVNSAKTFTSGSFRESCGVDAFAGKLVTPVYIRQPRPENKQQVSSIISWSATANLFFKKGYVRTAEYMHSICAGILGYYPEISETCSGLGRIYRFGGIKSKIRFNSKLHRPEVRAWIPSAVYRTDELDGYAALQKSLLKLERHQKRPLLGLTLEALSKLDFDFQSTDDPKHLERTALYGAVNLKLRWVPTS